MKLLITSLIFTLVAGRIVFKTPEEEAILDAGYKWVPKVDRARPAPPTHGNGGPPIPSNPSPEEPSNPFNPSPEEPSIPSNPSSPSSPEEPSLPSNPISPEVPSNEPSSPSIPSNPSSPEEPSDEPSNPFSPEEPSIPSNPISPEEPSNVPSDPFSPEGPEEPSDEPSDPFSPEEPSDEPSNPTPSNPSNNGPENPSEPDNGKIPNLTPSGPQKDSSGESANPSTGDPTKQDSSKNNGNTGGIAKADPNGPKRRYNIPVLSGTAYVGQLYDAKTDQLIPDQFLWKRSDMTILETGITNVFFETKIEESQMDRMNMMDIDASMKLSFMGGMVEVSGSAKYLSDEKFSDDWVRMTFTYKKKGKQLQVVSSESKIHDSACDPNLGATHVVTEVKTGFNAFLLFESKSSTSSSKKEIGGSLKVLIKSIPQFQIDAEAKLNITTKENEIKNSLTFKFYGDTTVDPPPATFEDAVQIYQSLPAKSKEDERVVSFTIAPLRLYCDQSTAVLNEVANSNVEYISQMIMDFNAIEKVLRKLKDTRLALDFQRYRKVLLDLETRFENTRSEFTAQIQTLLPKIREGVSDPAELTKLLQEYNNSPYEKERFLTLLNTRQKEIETAEFIIYHPSLPSTDNLFIDLDATGDMSKCIIDHDYALVYELEIMPPNPESLGAMHENKTLDETDKWFMKELEVGKNRPLMNDFIKLTKRNEDSSASICFMISLEKIGQSQKKFQLKLLKEGKTIIEDFQAPQVVWKMDHIEKGVNTAKIQIYYNQENVNNIVKNGKTSINHQVTATYKSHGPDGKILSGPFVYTSDIDITKASTEILLDNLVAGSFYSIQYSISLFEDNNKIAEGENSLEFYFDTLITSPPAKLECKSDTANSLKITWDDPSLGMEGLEGYSFSYRLNKNSKGEKIFDGHTTTKEVDFTTHIKPAHVYNFHVNLKAQPKEITLGGISHTKQSESLEAIVPCYSRPSKPLGLKYTKKTGDSVTLEWEKYKNLDKTQFVEYHLKISKKLSTAESPIIKSSSKTSYKVTGLESATLYDVQVCVSSVDYGESEYTEKITFKTNALSDSGKSEVAKLEDTVQENKQSLVKMLGDVQDDMNQFVKKSAYDQEISNLKNENSNLKSDVNKRVLKTAYDSEMQSIKSKMSNVQVKKTGCSWTGWQNEWDREVLFTAPEGKVIDGVHSVHNNKKEDRRFDYHLCNLSVN